MWSGPRAPWGVRVSHFQNRLRGWGEGRARDEGGGRDRTRSNQYMHDVVAHGESGEGCVGTIDHGGDVSAAACAVAGGYALDQGPTKEGTDRSAE